MVPRVVYEQLKQQAKERGYNLSKALDGGWVLRPLAQGPGKPGDHAIHCKTVDEIRERLNALRT